MDMVGNNEEERRVGPCEGPSSTQQHKASLQVEFGQT